MFINTNARVVCCNKKRKLKQSEAIALAFLGHSVVLTEHGSLLRALPKHAGFVDRRKRGAASDRTLVPHRQERSLLPLQTVRGVGMERKPRDVHQNDERVIGDPEYLIRPRILGAIHQQGVLLVRNLRVHQPLSDVHGVVELQRALFSEVKIVDSRVLQQGRNVLYASTEEKTRHRHA